MENKKSLLKTLVGGTIGLALLGGFYITTSNNKNYLRPENFNKAEWIEFYNANGRIWSCYTNENIPKNQPNWHLYIDKVREENNNTLRGRILLPDLDRNGEVGK